MECGDIPGTRRKQIAAALRAVSRQWSTEIEGQPTTEFISGIQNCITALNEITEDLEGQQ